MAVLGRGGEGAEDMGVGMWQFWGGRLWIWRFVMSQCWAGGLRIWGLSCRSFGAGGYEDMGVGMSQFWAGRLRMGVVAWQF